MAFSHDSTLLASGSKDKTIRLWSPLTGDHIRTLLGHTGVVNSVRFSPDSEVIVSGASDHTVRIWSTTTCECLNILEGHADTIKSVAISHDGKFIVSRSADLSVRIWSVVNGEHLHTLEEERGCANSLSLLSASYDIFWDLAGSLIWIQKATEGYFSRIHDLAATLPDDWIACSPDGAFAAFVSGTNFQVHRVQSDNSRPLVLTGLRHLVLSVAFSHDSKIIASSSADGSIWIWSNVLLQGDEHGDGLDTGVQGWSEPSRARVAPDSTMIAVASETCTDLLSFATGEMLHKLPGGLISRLNFSRDSEFLATLELWQKNVRICSTHTGSCVCTLEYDEDPTQVAFSADSTHLAVGFQRKVQVQSWQANPITTNHVCDFPDRDLGRDIGALAFSQNGKLLASSLFGSKRVMIGCLDGRKDPRVLQGLVSTSILSFSSDSSLLASCSDYPEQAIRIFCVRTGASLQDIRLSCPIFELSFDLEMATLNTSGGSVLLEGLMPSPDVDIAAPSVPKMSEVHFDNAYSLSHDGSWIQYGVQNILWLPFEYRPPCLELRDAFYDVRQSTVLLCPSSGGVKIFRFDTKLYESSLL